MEEAAVTQLSAAPGAPSPSRDPRRRESDAQETASGPPPLNLGPPLESLRDEGAEAPGIPASPAPASPGSASPQSAEESVEDEPPAPPPAVTTWHTKRAQWCREDASGRLRSLFVTVTAGDASHARLRPPDDWLSELLGAVGAQAFCVLSVNGDLYNGVLQVHRYKDGRDIYIQGSEVRKLFVVLGVEMGDGLFLYPRPPRLEGPPGAGGHLTPAVALVRLPAHLNPHAAAVVAERTLAMARRSEAGLGPGSSRPPPAQPAPGHRRKKARPHRAAWDAAGEDAEWDPRAEREGGRARRGLRPLRRAAAPAPGVEPYADFYSGHEYDSAGGGSPRSFDSEPSREAGSVLATAPLAAHAPGRPATGPPGRNVVRLRLPARRGRSPGEAGAGKGPDAMALPRPAPAPGDVPRIESLAMLAGLVADASGPDPEGWAGKNDARGSAVGLLTTTLALIVAGAAAALTPALARAGPPSAGPPSTEAARTGVRALRFTDQGTLGTPGVEAELLLCLGEGSEGGGSGVAKLLRLLECSKDLAGQVASFEELGSGELRVILRCPSREATAQVVTRLVRPDVTL
ncbi:hypothetical protein ACKKBF_B20865 [Auxenochlorella protothecoides x Auxenochlorella symbiontica]